MAELIHIIALFVLLPKMICKYLFAKIPVFCINFITFAFVI